MPKSIRLAAAQMDAAIAPRATRFERAAEIIREAARAGADLVVLPEMFNTGYGYDPSAAFAEPWEGPSLQFLATMAREFGVHVAGSFLVAEQGEVFNSLALVSPIADFHRYDKVHPWGWERALFRGSRERSVIADTALGRIGMLICWDTAHADLWAEYAGKVDCLVISSCPPDVTRPTFRLDDGTRLTVDDSPLLRGFAGTAHEIFGAMVDEQAAWLGVPVVASVGSGSITTDIPRPGALALVFSPFRPRIDLGAFRRVEMQCDLTPGCKVVDADGHRVAERSQKDREGFCIAEVDLTQKNQTLGKQPRARVKRGGYWLSDVLLPRLMRPTYQVRVSEL